MFCSATCGAECSRACQKRNVSTKFVFLHARILILSEIIIFNLICDCIFNYAFARFLCSTPRAEFSRKAGKQRNFYAL